MSLNTLWRLLPSLGSKWRQVDNIFRGSVSRSGCSFAEDGHSCLVELEYRSLLVGNSCDYGWNTTTILDQVSRFWCSVASD
jgi:hypothetical protein